MNTCKHVLLRSILTFSFFLLLASCQQQEETAETSGTPVDVSLQITVEGIREYASGMDDASSVETRATVVAGPLEPNVKFFVLAFQRNQVKDRALYTVNTEGTGIELVSAPMKLSPGSYKFVAYSLNNDTELPKSDNDGVLSVTNDMNGLLLGDDAEESRIVGYEPVSLTLTFTPMFSKVKVKIDAAGLKANVLSPGEVKLGLYTKASLSLLGRIFFNYAEMKEDYLTLTFSDAPGETRTSDAIYVLPNTETPKVTIKNAKVQGGYSPFTGEGTLCPLLPGKEYVYTHFLRGTPLRGANCFIIYKPGSYAIDATIKGNGEVVEVASGSSTVTASTVPGDSEVKITGGVSAKLLWETANLAAAPIPNSVVKDVTYDSLTKEIKFTTTEKEGNALIAVCDAGGKVLWSWHIWRTNEGPLGMPLNAISGATVLGELTLMDRNLGALRGNLNHLSVGLHYQWGRKDPMPGFSQVWGESLMGNTGGAPTLELGKKTVAQSIENPTAFFTVEDSYDSDWCESPNDNLWGAPFTGNVYGNGKSYNKNKGVKTIYDPCPPGWRMPPAYTYAVMVGLGSQDKVGGQNGAIYFENTISMFFAYLPFSGSRLASGKLDRVKNKIWTASSEEKGAANFFYTDKTNPDSSIPKTIGRAYGASCRCIKE